MVASVSLNWALRLGGGRSGGIGRESGDVAFENVRFENNSLSTLKDRRCGGFAAKADVGEGF